MMTYNSKSAQILKEGIARMKARQLDVFDKHQLKIARDTLNMSDAVAFIMGGMDKETARAVILKLTGKPAKE